MESIRISQSDESTSCWNSDLQREDEEGVRGTVSSCFNVDSFFSGKGSIDPVEAGSATGDVAIGDFVAMSVWWLRKLGGARQ